MHKCNIVLADLDLAVGLVVVLEVLVLGLLWQVVDKHLPHHLRLRITVYIEILEKRFLSYL